MIGIFGKRERAHNDCICTSQPIYNLHLGTTKIGKRYSLSQASKSRSECRQMNESFSRWLDGASEWAAVKKFEMISDKKKRVILTHGQLDDTRSYIYIYKEKNRAVRTTRLACSNSPIMRWTGLPLKKDILILPPEDCSCMQFDPEIRTPHFSPVSARIRGAPLLDKQSKVLV